jgi:hypothetical protein
MVMGMVRYAATNSAAVFGEPRRMAACTLLSSFEARKKERAPQDDGFGLQRARMLTPC